MKNTLNITIQRIQNEDASELEYIGRKTFYDTFTGTCTEEDMAGFLDVVFSPEQIKTDLSDPEDYFFWALVDGKPAGYLRVKEDYSSFEYMRKWKSLELKRLYVLSEFHGHGVAHALMEFAVEFAKTNDYQVIWLGVWEHNYRARRFYEKSGFSNSGHTHDFPIGNTPQTDCWYWQFLNGTTPEAALGADI